MEPSTKEEIEIARHRELRLDAIRTCADYPDGKFAGRGIVICGGGRKYFPCVWVLVNELRRLQCRLPIQIWHLGPSEWSEPMKQLMLPFQVSFVDALEVRRYHPVRILNGWEIKPYALIHCPFSEVLSLDADNVPIRDPEYLFETPEFRRSGAVFWPDFGRLGPERDIWNVLDLEHRDEPEVESGQVLLDKAKCWKALQLTMHLNEYSDFYYRYIHGDKETFHLAWRVLGASYEMPSRGIEHLDFCTMCQHDFERERIFQHRNLAKWSLSDNRNVKDFKNEEICLEHIAKLGESWSGWSFEPVVSENERDEQIVENVLKTHHFVLLEPKQARRLVMNDKSIVSEIDGRVIAKWCVQGEQLILGDRDGRCKIFSRKGGTFEWIRMDSGENTAEMLLPLSDHDQQVAREFASAGQYTYERKGLGERELKFHWDGTISRGSARCERSWTVYNNQLYLCGEDGVIAKLDPQPDHKWQGAWLKHECCDISLVPSPARRKILVFGLQRTGTNLITRFCKEALNSSVNRWAGNQFWKHGSLPAEHSLENAFLIMCVRHPLDWLVAQYRYFLREHGKDLTIDSKFDPDQSFEVFARSPHYGWATPIDRWNVMNRYWLSVTTDRPVSSTIVRMEDVQGTALQRSTFQRIAANYDVGCSVDVDKALCGLRISNQAVVTSVPCDFAYFYESHYLRLYTSDLLRYVTKLVDSELASKFGYAV